MRRLLILGSGGHGRVVADCALEMGVFENIAFLDDTRVGEKVLGLPVVGTFADAQRLMHEYGEASVALGNNVMRLKLINHLLTLGYYMPALIHPKATISRFVSLAPGVVVLAGTVINASTKIGMGSIINTSTSVDHDCIVGAGVHISPGAHLGGAVEVGDCTWIGLGARVINNLRIGCNAIIGAGSTVIKDVPDAVLVAGVPAVEKRKLVSVT